MSLPRRDMGILKSMIYFLSGLAPSGGLWGHAYFTASLQRRDSLRRAMCCLTLRQTTVFKILCYRHICPNMISGVSEAIFRKLLGVRRSPVRLFSVGNHVERVGSANLLKRVSWTISQTERYFFEDRFPNLRRLSLCNQASPQRDLKIVGPLCRLARRTNSVLSPFALPSILTSASLIGNPGQEGKFASCTGSSSHLIARQHS